MDLEHTRSFIMDSVALTLRVKKTLTYESAALFVAGMMGWGYQYGFSEVEKAEFISPSGSPLALAELKAFGNGLAIFEGNHTTDTTSLTLSLFNATDPFHDPFLYPIPTVPGFYIRFMTHNVPLPRYDCLRALEAADATLLIAYQQKSRLLDKPRTWTSGKVAFTLTPAPELNEIDATSFVVGTMQLGSEKGFVEAKAIFLRMDPNLKGQLKFYGTGRLARVDNIGYGKHPAAEIVSGVTSWECDSGSAYAGTQKAAFQLSCPFWRSSPPTNPLIFLILNATPHIEALFYVDFCRGTSIPGVCHQLIGQRNWKRVY